MVLLVDAARLWRGEIDGLFQPVKSAVLEAAHPGHAAQQGRRPGLAVVRLFHPRPRGRLRQDPRAAQPTSTPTKSSPSPVNKGRLCTRSGSHPYNLSLFGAMTEHLGPQGAETWLKGLVDNMARAPKGGDTDQIKGVASGECAVALTNSYYLARMMRSGKPEDRAVVEKVAVVFPNQADHGTHVNIAGGAVARHAKNREAAVKFLEYLASDSAQNYFANGNNEWPAVAGLRSQNPALLALGDFKTETVPISVIGMNQVKVQQMLDRVGFK